MKKILLLSLILFSFCVPTEKPKIAPVLLKYEKNIKEADICINRGCYSSLQKAFQICQNLYSVPSLRKTVAKKLIRVSLLVNLREKELGIINESYINRAHQLIKENSFLRNFLPYVEIIDFLKVKVEGVLEDIGKRKFSWEVFYKKLEKVQEKIREKAKEDIFFAYLWVELYCSRFLKEKGDISVLLKYYPDSLLIKYKLAICGEQNTDILSEIIKAEPCFHEIYFWLGKSFLMRKNFFDAEQNFLKAFEEIPDSVSLNISLASIYFYFEEFEKSIEYYNRCLELAPHYRDALLGKAISLGYLERYKEAISVLEKLIFLGKWYLGETNYWLAWNKHRLGLLEEAWLNIEKAKKYLPTSSEVYTLSGILAFEKNDLDKAEKDLKKALVFEPTNAEALFNLGNVYAKKEKWGESGIYFEKASEAYEILENFIKKRITKIKDSSLPQERKNRIIKKLEKKFKKFLLLKATSFYNASAGYFNAGDKNKALIFAKKAMRHPLFKEKAKNIILKIENK